jgi:hypothetical protein
VPIFSSVNNALLGNFSAALLGEYQRNGHWRYKNIKGRKSDWSNGHKVTFHKRLCLYDQIEREVPAMGSRNGPYCIKVFASAIGRGGCRARTKIRKDKS